MRIGLLAKKVGMSRFYDSAGLNHPVTILEVDNCQIIGINTLETKNQGWTPLYKKNKWKQIVYILM